MIVDHRPRSAGRDVEPVVEKFILPSRDGLVSPDSVICTGLGYRGFPGACPRTTAGCCADRTVSSRRNKRNRISGRRRQQRRAASPPCTRLPTRDMADPPADRSQHMAELDVELGASARHELTTQHAPPARLAPLIDHRIRHRLGLIQVSARSVSRLAVRLARASSSCRRPGRQPPIGSKSMM